MQFIEAGFDPVAGGRALARARRLPCLRWLNAADAVNLGSDASLDNLLHFEYLTLIYPTSAFTSGGILGKGTSGGGSRRSLELRTGQTATNGLFGTVDLATQDAWAEADVILLDRWQWAGMQYSDTTKAIRLFHARHPLLPVSEPTYSGSMTGTGATGDNASLNQFLGCYGGGTSGGAGKWLAFAAIANRLLTDAERWALQRWVMGRGGYVPAGMVGLYYPGLHSALRVVDYSGRGNHGSVSGPLVGPGPLFPVERRRRWSPLSLVAVSADLVIPMEAVGGLVSSYALAHEALLGLARGIALDQEAVQALRVTASAAHEALAGLAVGDLVAFEALAGVAGAQVLPHEAAGRVTGAAVIPFEALAALTRLDVLAYEVLHALQAGQLVAFEALGGVALAAVIPHEAEGQFTQMRQPLRVALVYVQAGVGSVQRGSRLSSVETGAAVELG